MMRLFVVVLSLVVLAGGCGSNPKPPEDAGTPVQFRDGGSPPPADGGTPTPDGGQPAADGGAGGCPARTPDGCPPTTGNAQGIGAACTAGGNQCTGGNVCDKDLDPVQGQCMCIKIGCAAGACGTSATCCSSPATQGIPVCLPNGCATALGCTLDP